MSRTIAHGLALTIAIAIGYSWGRTEATSVGLVSAQEAQDAGPSSETQRKIQAANDALKVAMEGLKSETRYNPATKGMNVYAVLCGGLDAVDDLESGRGVDPDTFAALYAGQASDEVQPHIGQDADGRLTYKNKLVRLYPVTRLKRLAQQRMVFTGEIPATAASSKPQ